MKKLIVLGLAALGMAILLGGCTESVTYTYEDMLGEWDFPDGSHISVMQADDDPSAKKLDIHWTADNTEYFVMADGTASGATFTGKFAYSETDVTDPNNQILIIYYGDDPDEPLKDVTITLSLENGKLKAVCTGDQPIGGETFTLGTL
ncbi:MAG: hypothetical protein AB7C91_12945 [Sphaerochaeta sp.]|uniref:hypothetical protein n=1 Tax=Sphaerochaeta sp. TaxID=1972642 RepID=UPI002FCC27C9